MKLDNKAIEWIKQEFIVGRTFEEIALDTGWSVQTVKRALAESHTIQLSWHKSKAQHKLLSHLSSKGIHTLEDLGKLKEVSNELSNPSTN